MKGIGYQSFYDRKRLNDWLNDKTREEGANNKSVEYLREMNQLIHELSKIGTLTYFLVTRLNVYDARQMLNSAGKQKKLVIVVKQDLKRYKVDKKWEKTFEHDIASIQRRCDHVYKICQEDIRLTSHYPYFAHVGFDKLTDFNTAYSEDDETVLDWLIPEMEAWEENHRDEVEAHMESVKEEIRIRDEHKRKIAEKEKEEKEMRRAAKKAADAEVKEIKENRKKELARKRKLDRELDATVRRVHGGWRNG